MNRCLFLDARGRRCARPAQAGLFCRLHGWHAAPAEEEAALAGLESNRNVEEDEPIELPPLQRLLRRASAALLLAFFLFQTYLMMRELLR